ncbi:DUF1491 family protein [Sphingomonadaceae bacterium jetA1]|jgi:hypothetical protein|uniref:DUF1491 family protein n=1 Tax=Facivitalis istanbulensis TaxID=3075838 RepID=UPI003485E1AF
MGRLPTGLVVTALLRRMNDHGGMGMVLARGDPHAGGVLVVVVDPDGRERILERGLGLNGATTLIDSTPREGVTGYWRRRRSRDPDLWVVELSGAEAERFAAETILND